MTWLTAPRRKALYALLIALGVLIVGQGWVDRETWESIQGVIVALLGVLAISRTADPVAVDDDTSPTGESAGEASGLPEGTPTETVPADTEVSPVNSEGYVGEHREDTW